MTGENATPWRDSASGRITALVLGQAGQAVVFFYIWQVAWVKLASGEWWDGDQLPGMAFAVVMGLAMSGVMLAWPRKGKRLKVWGWCWLALGLGAWLMAPAALIAGFRVSWENGWHTLAAKVPMLCLASTAPTACMCIWSSVVLVETAAWLRRRRRGDSDGGRMEFVDWAGFGVVSAAALFGFVDGVVR